ncbi:hypothetical protein [Serratia microhaemolytica]|uniref:hypothetical protein n=1 Tax=Serratia microhaemolytica TaxID=2675110 RepID=UPI000FDF1CA8|nr:hypothetical protein [Serratia microhaemolytica]
MATRQERAFQRGIRAAAFWRKVKSGVLAWDAHCVAVAKKRNLPGWVGHTPLGIIGLTSLILVAMGLFMVASIVFTLLATLLAVLLLKTPTQSESGNQAKAVQPTVDSPYSIYSGMEYSEVTHHQQEHDKWFNNWW